MNYITAQKCYNVIHVFKTFYLHIAWTEQREIERESERVREKERVREREKERVRESNCSL